LFRGRKIERLRERLLRRGARATIPAPWSLTAAPPNAQAAYERILPYAEVIYLVIAADGVNSPAEQDALVGAIRYLSEGELGAQAAELMIAGFRSDLQREGIEQRLDDVASRVYGEREDRELALSLAAGVAAADGELDAREEQTIVGLAERLGFSPRQLQALFADDAAQPER